MENYGYVSISEDALTSGDFSIVYSLYSDDWSQFSGRAISKSRGLGWKIGTSLNSSDIFCNSSGKPYCWPSLAGSGWKDFAISYNSSTNECNIYLNGEPATKSTTSSSIDIASEFSDFNGYIGDIRVFASALNEDDVKILSKRSVSIQNDGGLCGYFREVESSENLLFNGDFTHGTSGWTGSGLTVYDGGAEGGNYLKHTGRITSEFIPVNAGDKYQLSFYTKNTDNTSINKNIYYSIACYDKDFKEINIKNVNVMGPRTISNNSITTGSTSVELVNASVITDIHASYSYLAIFRRHNDINSEYASELIPITTGAVSGNIVSFTSQYTGSTIKAPFYVRHTKSGGTYIYPLSTTPSVYLTEDWSYHKTTIGGNSNYPLRAKTRYIKLIVFNSSTGSGNLPLVSNVCIKNISRAQPYTAIDTNQIANAKTFSSKRKKYAETSNYSTGSKKIRFIRDSMNGMSTTTSSCWKQIQVLDKSGINIAEGVTAITASGTGTVIPSTTDTTIRLSSNPLLKVTDGDFSSENYLKISGNAYIQIDLGKAMDASSILIHRPVGAIAYNNIVSVSLDGENWEEIHNSAIDGEYTETEKGNRIELIPDKVSISKNGTTFAKKLIEI